MSEERACDSCGTSVAHKKAEKGKLATAEVCKVALRPLPFVCLATVPTSSPRGVVVRKSRVTACTGVTLGSRPGKAYAVTQPAIEDNRG